MMTGDGTPERPLRVLLVDDDARIRDFLVDAFTASRCLVSAAGTAEEALDLLASERAFDLVVADIKLPGLSGLDLLRAVKGSQPGTPVVLVTGWPTVNSAVFGLRHGAYDYLRKPFSVSEVQQLVQRVLGDRERVRPLEGRPAELPAGGVLRHVGVQGLFRIGELALQGVEAGLFVETALDYVVQGLGGDGAVILLRDDLGNVNQRQKGTPGLVNQLLSLLDGSFGALMRTGGREALALTAPEDPIAVLAALIPELGNTKGALCLGRDARNGAFLPDDQELVLRYAQTMALGLQKLLFQESLQDIVTDTIAFFITALESKDPSLKGHSARVSLYAGEISTPMGLTPDQALVTRRAATLHDLGKLTLLDALLLKPDALTTEEYAVIRRYPAAGARILRRLPFFTREVEAITHHLERYDGGGRPGALRGDEIPLPARIIAVADAFDAMTSARPYRPPRPLEVARDEIVRNAGSQFDPAVVDAFTSIATDRLAEISRYYDVRGLVWRQPIPAGPSS